jgi:uncharacterized protein
MKYLILLLVIVAVIWFMRSKRPPPVPPPPRRNDAPAEPENMLACTHCGLHLPRHEALPGRGGVFCGEAHRAAYEKAHPSS